MSDDDEPNSNKNSKKMDLTKSNKTNVLRDSGVKHKKRSHLSTRSTEKQKRQQSNDDHSNKTTMTTRSSVRINKMQSIEGAVKLRNAERVVVTKAKATRKVTNNAKLKSSKVKQNRLPKPICIEPVSNKKQGSIKEFVSRSRTLTRKTKLIRKREKAAYIKKALAPTRTSQKKEVNKIIKDILDTEEPDSDDNSKDGDYVQGDDDSDKEEGVHEAKSDCEKKSESKTKEINSSDVNEKGTQNVSVDRKDVDNVLAKLNDVSKKRRQHDKNMARRKKRCIESYCISEGMEEEEVKRLLGSGDLHYIEHTDRRRNKGMLIKKSELKDNQQVTTATGSMSKKNTDETTPPTKSNGHCHQILLTEEQFTRFKQVQSFVLDNEQLSLASTKKEEDSHGSGEV